MARVCSRTHRLATDDDDNKRQDDRRNTVA